MFYALLTFPSATTTIQEAANYANPWITEFLPLIGIGFGIFLFGVITPWLIRILRGGFSNFFTQKSPIESEKDYWHARETHFLQQQKKGGSHYF